MIFKILINIIVILFLSYCTYSDVSISKSPIIFDSFHPNHNFFYDMKTHIKTVLNITRENLTMDAYIENMFHVENANPTYIFVLPDDHNQTVIFRRSDFYDAIFPNVTTINKFKAIYNMSSLILPREDLLKDDNDFFETIRPEKLIQSPVINFSEDENMNIVSENLRTERNFFKMMEELNDHPESFTKNPVKTGHSLQFQTKHLNQPFATTIQKPIPSDIKTYHTDNVKSGAFKYKITTKPPSTRFGRANIDEDVDWGALGLEGWSGGLRSTGNDDFRFVAERPPASETSISNLPLNGRSQKNYFPDINPYRSSVGSSSSSSSEEDDIPKTKFKFKAHYTPIENQPPRKSKGFAASSYDLGYKKNTNLNNDQKYYNHHRPSVDDTSDHPEISEQLSVLLSEERKKYKIEHGFKQTEVKPMFPVTSSRASHKNEDVFIARANNPFGHSTKWRWSNSSDEGSAISTGERESRKKRGVVQLYSMVKCATGCDPLIYKGYGCYCGFLGSGRTLDGIDRCCAMHDYCYSVSSCPMFLEYFVPYLWKCYRGRPLCAVDHGEWGGPGSCAARLCECDRILSKCLRRFYCPRKRAVCTSSPWRLFQNFFMEI